MTKQQYARYYDRSIELMALKKHRKLSGKERAEFAHICEEMFLAQVDKWHEERAQRQHVPVINGGGIH